MTAEEVINYIAERIAEKILQHPIEDKGYPICPFCHEVEHDPDCPLNSLQTIRLDPIEILPVPRKLDLRDEYQTEHQEAIRGKNYKGVNYWYRQGEKLVYDHTVVWMRIQVPVIKE